MSRTISTFIIILVISVILVTCVSAHNTSVSVNSPERVDSDFSVVIEIENAADLDSGQFDLSFDPAVVNVTGVDDGNIGGTVIPIADWALAGENTIRVLFNLPGIDGVSGSGSLAAIHFEMIVPGDCAIEISDGLLVNNMAEMIPASWNGVESVVPATKTNTRTSVPADATERKTPGFGAVFAMGMLAAAYLMFRKE
ncbi:MAG: hypothetical protein GIS02_00475 [Methanosarcinales archaeon]|uniref:Cohesin domain-containing protein n=1 Tax=Candidatus Ethanoperedens thermophilum TaxID=2766897 RepID=A0A848D5Y7_9EURY|nr:hypothetical protein [Candidatus Ethanoperedens thermophilum]